MRRHRFGAVALALADQDAAHEACDARVDVHDRAACEIEGGAIAQYAHIAVDAQAAEQAQQEPVGQANQADTRRPSRLAKVAAQAPAPDDDGVIDVGGTVVQDAGQDVPPADHDSPI